MPKRYSEKTMRPTILGFSADCGANLASSPHSVTLVQLRFASFALINLRWDFHPQECARAGRTKKTAPEGGSAFKADLRAYMRSKTVAMPWPPPMHMVTSA